MLALTAVFSLILGMGLPTANYIVVSVCWHRSLSPSASKMD